MKIKLFILFVFIKIMVFSQLNCESQRYISEVFTDHTFDGAIQFGSDDPYGIINNQNLYLDVYQPLGDTLDKRPVIVHQFGGGYLIGWRSEPNIPAFADKYTKRGFVFISIDYRIGFNVLDAGSAERAVYRGIVDLKASLRYIVDHADSWGIDTNQIFLTGTSAGSISAMGQTYMQESDRPNSTFGTFLEPTDLGCINCTANHNHNNKEVDIQGIISNWGAVIDTSVIDPLLDPKDNVPLISFHGTNDNAVFYVEGSPFSVPYFPNMQGSFLIHKRLEHLGIKNKLVPLVGFGHEPQLLNPQLTDTIVIYGSQFIYEIMQGNISPIQGDTSVCLNDIVTYSIPYVNGSNYCWEVINGNIISENQNTINIEWNTIGNHILKVNETTKLKVNKYRELNIEVQTLANPTINYSSNNGLFNFTSNLVNNASYYWNFGDGNFGTSQFINHQYVDTGNYPVILSVDNGFCVKKDTIQISSDICPIANFSVIVEDSFAYITNHSTFYNNVHYSFGNGNFSNNEITSIQYENEGFYTIQQIVYNNFCIDTFEYQIEIVFCSVADFSFSTNGLLVDFTSNSFNTSAQFWNFGDGNTNGTLNPSHNFLQTGNYNVQLIAYSSELCSDTMVKTIFIEEKEDSSVSIIHIEDDTTAFYPNPSSGIVFYKTKNINNLKVFNILAKEVKIIYGNNYINLSTFKKGVYFISYYKNHQKYIQKIFLN